MRTAISMTLMAIAFLLRSQVAYSCVCCSDPNTFYEAETSLSYAEGVRFTGKMGLYIYGERGEPEEMDIGKSQVSGLISEEAITLALNRDGKQIGALILQPREKPTHKKMGLDFLLTPEFIKKLRFKDAAPIYHEITVKVRVEASEGLKKALDVSFAPEGVLVFHGNSNNCWDPGQPEGRWSFQYSVIKGSTIERGLARGTILAR